MKKCPCHSKKNFSDCCEPILKGKTVEDAETLMRSRYAAYSLGLADYIIDTTHTESKYYLQDRDLWKRQIIEAYGNTRFDGLTILDHTVNPVNPTVTFKAILSNDGEDMSFTEKSFFKKESGRLKYIEGIAM